MDLVGKILSGCFPFRYGGYASFVCNTDGSTTVTPFNDPSCTTSPSGPSSIVTATTCNPAGSTAQQYFTTTCFAPPKYTLTGYFKDTLCGAKDDFFLYPLGTCTTPYGSSTGRVVYSAHRSHTEIKLKYQIFQLPDCSDAGSHQKLLLTLNKTCSSSVGYEGSEIGTILPAPPRHHRYISFFPDSGCSENVQEVLHVRDGCAPVPGGYAKFHCMSDGSSTVQMHGSSDSTCSLTPTGELLAVQPSACSAVGGVFMTTFCFF